MTKPTLLALLLIFFFTPELQAQYTSVEHQYEQLSGPTPMNWVTQRFLVHKGLNHWDFAGGLETQSAILGEYGGFYVFGLHGRTSLLLGKWKTHAGISLATGGGAGAPDGDGLMYRIEGGVARSLNKRSFLGLTYNFIDFPTGNITSNHAGLQFSYQLPYQWQPQHSNIPLFDGALSVLGGVLFLDENDASRINSTGQSIYTGIRFSQEVKESLELDLQLGASAVGATDGFMDYKAGMTQIIGNMALQPFLRGQIGSGGGGSVETGGGIASSFGAGIRFYDSFELSYLLWDAFQTQMQAPMIELAYRVPFTTNFGFVSTGHSTTGMKRDLRVRELPLILGSRWNLKNGLDRNGLPYQPMGSIFLGTKIETSHNFWLSGETLWAATGGYGAYAEGMFGIYHDIHERSKSLLGWNASVVAAGGGGIETNKGLAVAAGFHYTLKTSTKNKWTAVVRKKYFGVGAYNPWVLGVQYEPTFNVFSK